MRVMFMVAALALCAAPAMGGDRVQRIEVNGKPFFPIGVYQHPRGAPNKVVLLDLANSGFNCVIIQPNTPDDVLAEMNRLGIGGIVAIGSAMVLGADSAAKSENLKKLVTELKEKPGIIGWEGPDEPLWNLKGKYRARDGAERPAWDLEPEAQKEIHTYIDSLKDGYALVKSLDPGRPVLLNFAPRSEVEELHWFTSQKAKGGYRSDGRTAADAFGVDIYPIPGGGGNNGLVHGVLTPSAAAVGAFTRKQREVAGNAPIYMVLQGCGILDWDPASRANAQRHPTYEETRFMAFEAVANGANGILWWGTHYISAESALWGDIKRVARQLRALEPVLASGEVAPVSCSSKKIETIRYVWKGHNYVVAVNPTDQPSSAVSFGWDGLRAGRINVLFEERTVPALRTRFIDSFEPFGVHVYSDDFSSGATTAHKVRCTFGLPLNEEPFKLKPYHEAARLLRDMGIDAVCAGPEDKELIRELHRAGIKVYAETGVFSGKRHWESHPESRPINADGEPIAEPVPGYCGVCPNQQWLRQEILDKVARKFRLYEYDGLWLDFIRYPGRWEDEKPVLEETCFCPVCLEKFSRTMKITYPAGLAAVKDKARWILANYREEWTRFKCDTITNFVGEIKAAMLRQNPRAILGIFSVPWTDQDFGGAMLRILGQDIKALAKHVDVFSPMVYHGMCRFPMKWVADYTDYAWEATDKLVWPIVQVCDEPERMSTEDVFQTLRTGLGAPGSSGVMMFTFGSVLREGKLEAMKEALGTAE